MKKLKKILVGFLAICMVMSSVHVWPAKAATEVDVTNTVTMTNRKTDYSTDTTYIKMEFGGKSTKEVKANKTFYVNDNPTTATIDLAEYILVNGKSIRSHINGYASDGTIGSAFPMSEGKVYNPICLYVDSTSFKVYVLNSYLAYKSFDITLKAGFRWENTDRKSTRLNSSHTS